MEQGKKESQMKDAETFAFIALMIILAIFIILGLSSCNTNAQTFEDGKVYIQIDGQDVELVADEFGNSYLKYRTDYKSVIFVPFPFETEEKQQDSLNFYNVKQ